MNNIKVSASMAISLDGFTAGVHQSYEHPFGDNFDTDLLARTECSDHLPILLTLEI